MSSISWMIPSTRTPSLHRRQGSHRWRDAHVAKELVSKNIRVSSVLPDSILTERQPRLWLTPEYEAGSWPVARLVLFLASDDSSAITNQALVIDGGWV